MKPIWARPIKTEEVPQLLEWIAKIADINLVDPDVLQYPATFAMAAQKQGRPILYMPIQPVFMLESLAPSPEATELDEALALKEIVHAAVYKARELGHGEVYFLCSDPRVKKFAEAHGFSEVNVPLFRLKLNKLP